MPVSVGIDRAAAREVRQRIDLASQDRGSARETGDRVPGRRDDLEDPSALIGVTALLVVSEAVLVGLAPHYATVKPASVAAAMPLVLMISGPAAVGLAESGRLARCHPTSEAMAIMLTAGLCMRLLWLGVPVPVEDDFHRYLWDGALVAHGFDPYATAPAVVAASSELPADLAALRNAGAATLARINFADLTTIYPAVAQAAFALAHWMAPWRADGLRILLLTSDVCTVGLLLVMLQRDGRNPMLAAFYWLNPLVVFVTLATVHVDALLPPLLLGALLALHGGHTRLASAALALGVGVKIWPILLAPLFAVEIAARDRRSIVPAAAIFTGLVVAGLGPIALSASAPTSGLTAYAGSWSINNAPYAWARWLVGETAKSEIALRYVLGGLTASIALAIAFCRGSSSDALVRRALAIAAVLFYAAPAQFPWYALWFLPLAAAAGDTRLLLASVTLPAYFLFFPLAEQGRRDLFAYGVAFAHSLPVWAALAWRGGQPGWQCARSSLGRSDDV